MKSMFNRIKEKIEGCEEIRKKIDIVLEGKDPNEINDLYFLNRVKRTLKELLSRIERRIEDLRSSEFLQGEGKIKMDFYDLLGGLGFGVKSAFQGKLNSLIPWSIYFATKGFSFFLRYGKKKSDESGDIFEEELEEKHSFIAEGIELIGLIGAAYTSWILGSLESSIHGHSFDAKFLSLLMIGGLLVRYSVLLPSPLIFLKLKRLTKQAWLLEREIKRIERRISELEMGVSQESLDPLAYVGVKMLID